MSSKTELLKIRDKAAKEHKTNRDNYKACVKAVQKAHAKAREACDKASESANLLAALDKSVNELESQAAA